MVEETDHTDLYFMIQEWWKLILFVGDIKQFLLKHNTEDVEEYWAQDRTLTFSTA